MNSYLVDCMTADGQHFALMEVGHTLTEAVHRVYYQSCGYYHVMSSGMDLGEVPLVQPDKNMAITSYHPGMDELVRATLRSLT
jgi:hypothetical protein